MRFSLFMSVALIAAQSQALNLDQITKVTGFDPTKYQWRETSPGSGQYVKVGKEEKAPVSLSRVQQLIKEKEEQVAANAAANAVT